MFVRHVEPSDYPPIIAVCNVSHQQGFQQLSPSHGLYPAKDSEKIIDGVPVVEGYDGKVEDRILFSKICAFSPIARYAPQCSSEIKGA
jgi:hypothetical protein